MMRKFNHISRSSGELTLPGDKSISHRVLMISALAKGKSYLKNLSCSEDVISTIECLKNLGIDIKDERSKYIVHGNGFKGLEKPSVNLNAGNSGTTARLLSGILVAQNFDSTIIGDNSLSKRPMDRLVKPLRLLGGKISGSRNSTLPIRIKPAEELRAIDYELTIPSAQVKSAILLAGLHIEEPTRVIESNRTRNHTENLLKLDVIESNEKIVSGVSFNNYPKPNDYFIPGDISTAMYFIVLTLLTENSQLLIKNISLNKTRTAAIDLLLKMGAKIEIEIIGESNREQYGNLIVRSSELTNVPINREIIPLIIDEIPVLAVAGIFAAGEFRIENAGELRYKESDRIKYLCRNFSLLGLDVDESEDGFVLSGRIKNVRPCFKSFGDHRIAMALSILSCLLSEGGSVDGIEWASISNPDFLNQLRLISSA